MKTVLGIVLVLAAGLAGWLLIRAESPPAHRIFVGGQVLSMDAENRVFEALSVRGERIERLGGNREIRALADADTVVTELAGRSLLPGFVDAHGHFPGSAIILLGADLNSPPMGEITGIAELQDALRTRLQGRAAGAWLLGIGYDDTLLAEQRHPSRTELDAVSIDHPIYIMHVSGHMGVANSRALVMAGITADSEDPPGGVIVRQPGSREPLGLLEEAAHEPLAALVLDFSLLDGVKMAMAASDEYVSEGITTAQSGGVEAGLAQGLAALSRAGLIVPRLVLFGWYDQLGEQWLSGEFDPAAMASDRLSMAAVKIVADGSIQGFTGYLQQPYHRAFKGDPEYRGYPAMPAEELAREVARFHRADIQLAIHGNGDAAIDDILDAFAQAQAESPQADPRLILIHAQMAREDQLLRMKELGVTPSFFSAHTYYWGDRHRDIFMGPRRAARMSPTRSAQDIGLRYSVHLDTPVTPMQPLQLLWSTVNRVTTSGAVIGPEQRVSPTMALRAMTIDAAWQVFQEDRIGSLEPGKLADLVILSGDPLSEQEDIRQLKVLETVIGGVSVYQRTPE